MRKDVEENQVGKKKKVALVVAVVVVVALAFAGIGIGLGWFSDNGLFNTTQQAANENSGSNQTASSNGEESNSSSALGGGSAQEPDQQTSSTDQSTISVSLSIDSSRAAEYGYPESMVSTTVNLKKGASVYDALSSTGVSISGSSSYVSSIGGLSDLQFGSGSGWLYYVNGESPSVGYDSYILEGGEEITWIYTLDMGNDI